MKFLYLGNIFSIKIPIIITVINIYIFSFNIIANWITHKIAPTATQPNLSPIFFLNSYKTKHGKRILVKSKNTLKSVNKILSFEPAWASIFAKKYPSVDNNEESHKAE